MPQTKHSLPRARRKLVTPIHIIQLMDTIGPTRAAERLGVSTTLLHKARKDNEVNKVVEIAAGFALDHMGDKTPQVPEPKAVRGSDDLFMVAVPHEKAQTLQRLASAIGAELVEA